VALDATIGGTSSDSYITVADADTYHGNNLNVTDWTGASTADKEKALKMSTRLMDERIDWIGEKNTDTQALRYPRAGVTTPDGYSVETTELPTPITNACAEFAKYLIASDRTGDASGKGITSVGVGSVSLTFDKTDTADVLPSIVSEMLRGWGVIHERAKFGVATVLRT
jgi:hypothetical protein